MSPPAPAVDFAHTEQAQQRRLEKATTLARWCYRNGIGPEILHQDPQLRRVVVRRAGVLPPRELGGRCETWEMVAQLLVQRADWDRRHGVTGPPSARCVACKILGEPCSACSAEVPVARLACAACGLELDPVLPAIGLGVHPGCKEPVEEHRSGTAPEQPTLL